MTSIYIDGEFLQRRWLVPTSDFWKLLDPHFQLRLACWHFHMASQCHAKGRLTSTAFWFLSISMSVDVKHGHHDHFYHLHQKLARFYLMKKLMKTKSNCSDFQSCLFVWPPVAAREHAEIFWKKRCVAGNRTDVFSSSVYPGCVRKSIKNRAIFFQWSVKWVRKF